jgi:uncharacterized membrane protein YbhN (UPF0104 family)
MEPVPGTPDTPIPIHPITPAGGGRSNSNPATRRLGQCWKWLRWPAALGIFHCLYLHNQENLARIAATPKNWGYALAAFAAIVGSALIMFFRWYLLVRAQEFPFRIRDAIRYGFAGEAMNYFSVGMVGGDLFKAFLLARDQTSRRAVAAATVLLDRILGMSGLIMVGAFATLIPHDFPDTPLVHTIGRLLRAGTLAGVAGFAFLLIPATTQWRFVQRLPNLPLAGRIVGELLDGVRLYQSKPWTLLATLALSLAAHTSLISGFYFCARWMNQPWIPDLTAHFCFVPSAQLLAALGPAPAGIGPLEWAIRTWYVMLNPGVITEAEAAGAGLATAIAFRIVSVAMAAIGGVYYFNSRREISAAMKQAAYDAPSDAQPAALSRAA